MENLDKLTEKLLEWLETTEAFAQEQVPVILQEILTWNFAASITTIVLFLAFMTGYLIFLIKAEKPLVEEECTPKGVFTIIGGAVTAIGIIVVIAELYVVIQIYFAPRVYLIEYMKGLVD